jgi:hypothetical protein
MKIYEDHKKNVGKTSEIQNMLRPISSYHRNNMSGKRDEAESDFNLENFITKFSSHISKFKIKKNDFIDNPDIFLDKKEFHKLFKNARFEISNNELNELFSFRNTAADEGYILGKTFLNNFNFKWAEELENKLKLEIKEDINMTKINDEFKSLKEEVLEIIEKEIRSKSTAKIPSNLRKVKSSTGMSRPIPTDGRQSSKPTQNTQSSAGGRVTKFDNNGGGTFSAMRRGNSSYLVNTYKKKKQAEEEIMRLEILKRNKEYEKECIRKMSEANTMAEELNVMKAYTAYRFEVYNYYP